jgi:hypothetical protein
VDDVGISETTVISKIIQITNLKKDYMDFVANIPTQSLSAAQVNYIENDYDYTTPLNVYLKNIDTFKTKA